MASADLRKELDCSICLNIYTDPVMLTCGHNFCRVCIEGVLDTLGKSGPYTCPDCRAEFQDRPALYRNITLCNIVENLLSTQTEEERSEVFCTHCVDTPVLAVKSCLLCEASLCDKHLRVHSKSPEHILCDPTSSPQSRKCSLHNKNLEYYCTEDSACICIACRLDGAHRGHKVNMLAAASDMKKEKLKNVQQKLMTKRKETTTRICQLQEHQRKVIQKADGEKTKIADLLEDLGKRVMGEILRKVERVSHSVSDLISQLETRKDDLSRKIVLIEELCNIMDPLIILKEPDMGDLCDIEDGDDRHDDLNMTGILHTLHTGLSDIFVWVNETIAKDIDLSLDVTSAGPKLQISGDRSVVTAYPSPDTNLPDTPNRFKISQVLSSRSFSSGRHTWEVDVRGSNDCEIGLCYPSVDRDWKSNANYNTNREEWVKHYNKYWCLKIYQAQCTAFDYNYTKFYSIAPPSNKRIRMYLDYEAGHISFYEQSVPVRHLHTYNFTFTEPLRAVIGVWDDFGYVKIYGEENSTHIKEGSV